MSHKVADAHKVVGTANNNKVSDRRKFCKDLVVLTTGSAVISAMPITSHAFVGALLRLIFQGTIRRAVQTGTGRIMGQALRTGIQASAAQRGVTALGALGAISAGAWGVIGAVELKHLWSDGQIHALFGREPDVNVNKFEHEEISLEFTADSALDGDVGLPFMASALVIPQNQLLNQDGAVITKLEVGQGFLEPGEVLSLQKSVSTKLGDSRYVIVPLIEELDSGSVNNRIDFSSSAKVVAIN